MSIHEQITALLDGELSDGTAVAELMHVLAVSPEKQGMLVEQLAMKRRFASTAATIVPPASADLAILRSLGAVDAEIAAVAHDDTPTPAPVALPARTTSAPWRTILVASSAIVLLVGGFFAGSFYRGDGMPANETAMQSAASPTAAELLAARDSIAVLSRELALLASAPATGGGVERSSDISSRGNRIAANARPLSGRSRTLQPRVVEHQGEAIAAVHEDRPERLVSAIEETRPPVRESLEARRPALVERSERVTKPSDSLWASIPDAPIGIQVGLRNHARLSLPRVYGVSEPATALLDRELISSIALGGEDDGILARVRAGAAFGQTQFAMLLHTNNGVARVDTVHALAPQALYGRAFIAPEIVRLRKAAGLLEVGGWYSRVGGFGTVGLTFEYRPIEEVALHAGASSWLLWTRFNGVVTLSTNLNAHLGAMIGF